MVKEMAYMVFAFTVCIKLCQINCELWVGNLSYFSFFVFFFCFFVFLLEKKGQQSIAGEF